MAILSFLLAIVCITLFGFMNPIAAYPQGNTVRVHPGQSIQSAIDSAHGGDRIVVEAGTYAEQLTISKNGITLVGRGATITPPASPITNLCSGLAGNDSATGLIPTQAGICVAGSNVDLAPFVTEHRKVLSVGQRVKDTTISGFSVTGFSGINIAIVGGKDAIIKDNTLTDGAQYSALTVGSKNSVIKHNTVLSTVPTFIGICMDDVSTVTIAHNDVSGSFIGLCVQTSGADVHDNNVHDICIGAFVDPGVDSAQIQSNTFGPAPPGCPSGFTFGVIILGATKTAVKWNTITGIKVDGTAVGVSIADDIGATGKVSSGNRVQGNTFSGNDIDVAIRGNGTRNVVKWNSGCLVSSPAGLC